jgi:hypothetical protein
VAVAGGISGTCTGHAQQKLSTLWAQRLALLMQLAMRLRGTLVTTRYEVYLERKLERTLAMLIRLRELRLQPSPA